MEIIEKDPNKVKAETETSGYEENFDSKMTWEDEVDIELDNILSSAQNLFKICQIFWKISDKSGKIFLIQNFFGCGTANFW